MVARTEGGDVMAGNKASLIKWRAYPSNRGSDFIRDVSWARSTQSHLTRRLSTTN